MDWGQRVGNYFLKKKEKKEQNKKKLKKNSFGFFLVLFLLSFSLFSFFFFRFSFSSLFLLFSFLSSFFPFDLMLFSYLLLFLFFFLSLFFSRFLFLFSLLSFFFFFDFYIRRNSVWNSVYFGSMWEIKKLLPQSQNYFFNLSTTLVSGFIGGIFATTVNCPFDVVRGKGEKEKKRNKEKQKRKKGKGEGFFLCFSFFIFFETLFFVSIFLIFFSFFFRPKAEFKVKSSVHKLLQNTNIRFYHFIQYLKKKDLEPFTKVTIFKKENLKKEKRRGPKEKRAMSHSQFLPVNVSCFFLKVRREKRKK